MSAVGKHNSPAPDSFMALGLGENEQVTVKEEYGLKLPQNFICKAFLEIDQG